MPRETLASLRAIIMDLEGVIAEKDAEITRLSAQLSSASAHKVTAQVGKMVPASSDKPVKCGNRRRHGSDEVYHPHFDVAACFAGQRTRTIEV